MSGLNTSVEETTRMSGIKKAVGSLITIATVIIGVGLWGSSFDNTSNASNISNALIESSAVQATGSSAHEWLNKGSSKSTSSESYSDFSKYEVVPRHGAVKSVFPTSISIYSVNNGTSMARVTVGLDFDRSKIEEAKSKCGNFNSEYAPIKEMANAKFERFKQNALKIASQYSTNGFVFAIPTNQDGTVNQDRFDKEVVKGEETAAERANNIFEFVGSHISYSVSGVDATKKIQQAEELNPNSLKEVAISNETSLNTAMADLNAEDNIHVANNIHAANNIHVARLSR